jgi:hypothetical protein
MDLNPRSFWERLKAPVLRKAYVFFFDPSYTSPNFLAPNRRDNHLFLLAQNLVTRLGWSRYSLEELIVISHQQFPQASESLNEHLVWRALTYAERKRWVVRAETVPDGRGELLWDLTKEGETQASSVRIFTERARIGALIGFLGLTAAIFAGQVETFARIGLAVLVGFFLFALLVTEFMRSLLPYGIDFINAKEQQVQEELRSSGAEPWWPPRPEPRMSKRPPAYYMEHKSPGESGASSD